MHSDMYSLLRLERLVLQHQVAIVWRLSTHYIEMCGALTQTESRSDQQHAIKSELALIPLAQSCKELGENLLSVLNSLKVKARH